MSRKHYIETARIVRSHIDALHLGDSSWDHAAEATVRVLARDLADMFKRDNSRFDRDRFLHACGIDSERN